MGYCNFELDPLGELYDERDIDYRPDRLFLIHCLERPLNNSES